MSNTRNDIVASGPIKANDLQGDEGNGDYFIIAGIIDYNLFVMTTDVRATDPVMSATYVGNSISSLPSNQKLIYCKYSSWVPRFESSSGNYQGGTFTLQCFSDTNGTSIGYLSQQGALLSTPQTLYYLTSVTCGDVPYYGVLGSLNTTFEYNYNAEILINFTKCNSQSSLETIGYCTQDTGSILSSKIGFIMFLPISYYQKNSCVISSPNIGTGPAMIALQQCVVSYPSSNYKNSSNCSNLTSKFGYSNKEECLTFPGMYYCAYNNSIPAADINNQYSYNSGSPIFPACGSSGNYLTINDLFNIQGEHTPHSVSSTVGLCDDGGYCGWNGSYYTCLSSPPTPVQPPDGGGGTQDPTPPASPTATGGNQNTSNDNDSNLWLILIVSAIVIFLIVIIIVIIATLKSKKSQKNEI